MVASTSRTTSAMAGLFWVLPLNLALPLNVGLLRGSLERKGAGQRQTEMRGTLRSGAWCVLRLGRVVVHHLPLWFASTPAAAPARSPFPACSGPAPPTDPGLKDFRPRNPNPGTGTPAPPVLIWPVRRFFQKFIPGKIGRPPRDGTRSQKFYKQNVCRLAGPSGDDLSIS